VRSLGVGEVIAGPSRDLRRALLRGAAWVINLAVAEWAIRKRPARPLAQQLLLPSSTEVSLKAWPAAAAISFRGGNA
jgi:hypothetical protein